MKDSFSTGLEPALVSSMSEDSKGEHNSHLSKEQLLRLNMAMQEELLALTYAVSHDLEEPLRHIMSFSNLLAKRAEAYEDKDMQKFSAVVQSSGKTLESRLKAILEISRLSRYKVKAEIVDTESLIKEIIEHKNGKEGYQTQVQIDPLPQLNTTPNLFKLICEELLKNAFHFSSQEASPIIHIYAENPEEGICINIEDNGIGMGEQDIERMSRLFQQRKDGFPRMKKSIGLGLALAKRAANMIGAEIDFKISEAGNTCFQIRFI